MDNQHRKIKGYRELSQEEIDLMNRIKEQGVQLEGLLFDTHQSDYVGLAEAIPEESMEKLQEADRWRAIAKTRFQEGLMALTRAVAKPEFF